MRRAEIRVDERTAGHLEETKGGFRFAYLSGYEGPAVSLTMPVREEPYEYDAFPPFFDGLLPEGFLLDALLRTAKLDRTDYLGQLVTIGADCVGNVTVHAEND